MSVKRKDLKVIIPVLVLLIALLAAARLLPGAGKQANAGQLQTAGEAAAEPASAQEEGESRPGLIAADAYLKVQVGNSVYEPLALTQERELVIDQPDGKQNVVKITPDSVAMLSSSCDNQDCLHQGTVTLDNRDDRALMDMIICLPNQVMLQLLDREEAQREWDGLYGGTQ